MTFKQSPFKIITLDDHPMITDGVELLLENYADFQFVAAAHSWEELISKIRIELPDILILDLNIRGSNILNRIDPLLQQFPHVKILIFSSYNSPSLVKKAFAKNVNGYLLKDTTQDELLEALETIATGKIYIGNRVAATKRENFKIATNRELEDDFEIKNKLSNRELQVVQLMVEGLDSKEIANRLFISSHTVQSHRKNILRKLNLHSASEVVRFALQHNLV